MRREEFLRQKLIHLLAPFETFPTYAQTTLEGSRENCIEKPGGENLKLALVRRFRDL